MDWYYAHNNQQNGPVTQEALISMIQQGHVQPGDLVWREGMANWQPAAGVQELAGAAPPGDPSLGYFNPATAPVGPPVYAGFWLRFAAFIIDWIVLYIVGFIAGRLIGFERPLLVRPGFRGNLFAMNLGFLFTGGALGMVINWLYYALMECSVHQATLGKMALGLIVTDMNGRPIGFGRATGRHFGKLISDFTFLIGYMLAGWTQQKQALHDMMAGCLVLRKQ